MKVLMVGINDYPGGENDLQGCVNDINDWQVVITNAITYNLQIKILTNKGAKQSAIINGLKWLVSEATVESHIKIILDSCHSGTFLRLMGKMRGNPRYLPPVVIPARGNIRRFGIKPSGNQKHLLLSACKANQTAADAEFGYRYNGAFTYSLMQSYAQRKSYDVTAHDLYRDSRSTLKATGYEQTPTIEGPAKLQNEPIFTDNSLVFIYSGHGSQVRDKHSDETDGLDEIICPYDIDSHWDDPITDDVLGSILRGR